MKRRDVPRRPRRVRAKAQGVTDTYIRRGIVAMMGLLGITAFLVVAGQLVRLMLVEHDYYEGKAIRNQTRSTSVTASRGTIYDRNMEVLAASTSVENIFLDPLELQQNGVDIDALAKKLAPLLGLSEEYIQKQAADTSLRYKLLKRRQERGVCNAVRELIAQERLVGVHLEPDSMRYYPNHSVASQLLGFTNTENVGSEGLESYYNKILQGTSGAVITTKGNNETEMLYSYEKYYPATDGESLVLTIDLTVQRALEKQMRDAIDRYDVLNGAFGMVMDVNTGDILAMATLGGYDPNSYLEIFDLSKSAELEELYQTAAAKPEGTAERTEAFDVYNQAAAAARLKQWRNRCVSDGYEPGSTFKVITLASALDSGAVTLQNTFYCRGAEKFEGRSQILNCWRHQGHGSETTAQALQNSCNLAFAHIGLLTGGETLYDYCKAFGLMDTTGIDLPGEAKGLFHSREHLADNATFGTSYLISTSFGQTVKPTPIQVVRAVAAVVNGGYLLQPHVVSQVLDADGNVTQRYEREVIRQVISEDTSATMCELMESVVAAGTAKNAQVAGYRIGGKTGTAEKTDQRDASGQLTKDKIVSFIGVAPMESPQYVVLIALDTPNPATGQYVSGGVMAAPTVAAVFEDILPYLGIAPDYGTDERYHGNVTMPDVAGQSVAEAAKLLKDNTLDYQKLGGGSRVISQIPAAGRSVPGGATVLLYTDDSMPTDKVKVPQLYGKTAKEVAELLTPLGLYLQPKGADSSAWHVVATAQDLDPGTEVERGTTVTVLFTDTNDMD